MRETINTPRVLRLNRPLSLDEVRNVAPAVFAAGAHESRSDRYAYVPTERPLTALLDNGWHVWEARQQRSRDSGKDPYTKHMLRLRKSGDGAVIHGRDGTAEIVLINAHDGTASYSISAGYFRLVCSNGMVAGRTLGNIRVQHTLSLATSEAVLGASERVLTEKVPLMLGQIDRLREYETSPEQQLELANTALGLRYAMTAPPMPAVDLLRVRREIDAANNMWTVLNRIQENIMDGGWEVRSMLMGRRSMVRPVERVSANAAINMGLWDKAIELATAE
jgi:hypothetical protein